MKDKRISIYVRNQHLTPSSYYRIIQYSNKFDGEVRVNNIAPTDMYKNNQKLNKSNKFIYAVRSMHYYFVMLFRSMIFLIRDCINKPDYVIVSKVILPIHMPYVICKLLDYLTKNTTLYWDFDDLIFSKSNLKRQHLILGENSKNIIVTSEYLKKQLQDRWKEKCLLLPTTDGDLQGFNYKNLINKRKKSFEREIKLVWVATSVNLPHIINIIDRLDKAAFKIKKIFNKDLILTVVCDKPLNTDVKNLIIRNIVWTREVAKKEIYEAHIGIMPLIYNNFTLGKGGFKLVQYISTGLPVIASNVGFNKEVVGKGCGILVDDAKDAELWVDSIIELSSNWLIMESKSKCAYEQWNSKFSYHKNLCFWNTLIE